MKKTKIVSWSMVALLGLAAITWGTLVINDYNRVLRDYKKPIFAQVVSESAEGEHGEYQGQYQGFGYSISLDGRFRPESDPEKVTVIDGKGVVLNPYPNVLQAQFQVFGKQVGVLEREDPYL